MADETLILEESPGAIEAEQTFIELSKVDKMIVLSEKFADLKEFQTMSDGEKLNILIADRAEALKELADKERQSTFLREKDSMMKEHAEYEQREIETVRVRVFKERIYLEQMWNEAATDYKTL